MTTSQKGSIFISYRRADSAGYAGRIYDRLTAHFSEDAIFMDVDTIEGGFDFVKVLEDAVQSCDVLIALIGRQWLKIKDESGSRRLDNPEDFVRIEIATALGRDIRVIPVLVDGIDMPRSTELPENLKLLARRNALQVDHHSFNPDVYRLIEHIESALNAAEESRFLKAQAVKAAQEKTEKEAAAKAAREMVENEIAEKASKEKAEKEAEPEKLSIQLKRNPQRAILIIALVGLIFAAIFGLPSLNSNNGEVPETTSTKEKVTPEPTLTAIATNTVGPSLTPTKMRTPLPTSTPLVFNPHPDSSDFIDAFGVPMCLVPSGEFIMGNNDYDDEKPQHPVLLDSFYIDKYEVTNALYAACVNARVCDSPKQTRSYTRSSYYGNSEFDNYPVVYVDWYMAKKYCEWRGAQLPTEAQWEKAARGTDERSYPWGEGLDCSKANCSNGDAIEVGSYENGISPYGLYDMAGNIWEWVNDWYDAYPGNNNPNSDYSTAYRVLRGGAWVISYRDDNLRASNRYWSSPVNNRYDFGFRCAKEADP